MPVLYLTESDIEQLLDPPTAVAAMAEAFRQLANGNAENVPRARTGAQSEILHTMSASARYLGLSGWKAYFTTRFGALFHVGLYDYESGHLIALMQADLLGQLRTGATTAVAVDHLARRDLHELGLFGAGWQAAGQLAAVASVRQIKRVFVYSRTEQHRAAFVKRMEAQVQAEIVPVDRPQEAVEDLPLVVTATTSSKPVFDGHWLGPGSLVCAVGSNWLRKAEIDAETVRRSDRVVCDSIECCRREAGDFVDALERGIFDWSRAIELADVVAGRAIGERNPEANVLFKSVGMAIEDVALAAIAVARAGERGLGQSIDL